MRVAPRIPEVAAGGAATVVEYDILGRVKKQSVPTEVSVSSSPWTVTGDDSVFKYKQIEYDWMGRPTRTIPSDSDGTDYKDTLYEYGGCGCAGGLVTTVRGPKTTAIDAGGTSQTAKRRVQKSYEDPLGRTFQTEIWDLDGAGLGPQSNAPYSTVVLTFNGSDQAIVSRQYAGGSSSTYQETTSTFDGHGRLATRHNPIENSSTNTSWTYNADDTVATVTDPRGAVISYFYGNPSASEKRALLTGISYTGGSNIPDPGDVAFEYDNVGNRKLMKDGIDGSNPYNKLTYKYDFLSRLTSESKEFADDLNGEPTGGYRLEYTYHVGGGIKSITSPFNETVTYNSDKAGRTTGMGASGFGSSLTSFTSGVAYRAFGGIKAMAYSTTSATNITMTYDAALRPASYTAVSSANSIDIHDKEYSYYNDGLIKEATNDVDPNYTQVYEYDFAGRLKKNEVNDPAPGGPAAPYTQSLGYDAFNNLTSRSTTTDGSTARNYTATFTNGRKTGGGYSSSIDTYDAAGNITFNIITSANNRMWKFDAAGRTTEWLEALPYATTVWDQGAISTFDGAGREAKRLKRNRNRANGNELFLEEPEYYIWSSVTGQKISVLDEDGSKETTSVFLGGTEIAESIGAEEPVIRFTTTEPVAHSANKTSATGEILSGNQARVELEALGGFLATAEEEIITPQYHKGGSISNPEYGCVDPDFQTPMPCDVLSFLLNSGLDFPGFDQRNNPFGVPGEPTGPSLPDWVIGADDRPAGIDALNPHPGLLYWPGGDGADGHWSPISLTEDVGKLANGAFEYYLRNNTGCGAFAQGLNLALTVKRANFIKPEGNDRAKTLGQLGFQAGDVGDVNMTLAEVESRKLGVALTNFRTNTVYLFEDALPNRNLATLDDYNFLGQTVLHEALHLQFDSDHEEIAQRLGLYYDKPSADPEQAAANAIDSYIDGGCQHPRLDILQ